MLTCKSLFELGHRGERLIEPSSSWFPPKSSPEKPGPSAQLHRVKLMMWGPGVVTTSTQRQTLNRCASRRCLAERGILRMPGPSGLVLVSRTGDVGRTDSRTKVPNCALTQTQRVLIGTDSRTVVMEVETS